MDMTLKKEFCSEYNGDRVKSFVGKWMATQSPMVVWLRLLDSLSKPQISIPQS